MYIYNVLLCCLNTKCPPGHHRNWLMAAAGVLGPAHVYVQECFQVHQLLQSSYGDNGIKTMHIYYARLD